MRPATKNLKVSLPSNPYSLLVLVQIGYANVVCPLLALIHKQLIEELHLPREPCATALAQIREARIFTELN